MLWCQHRGADNRLRRDSAHFWPPTGASFPRAIARWTRIPHVGKLTWRRPIGRRSRTRLGRLGQRPSTTTVHLFGATPNERSLFHSSPKADSTFCVRWRRMVAGPQTARRGKAGAPRSLRSWAPAFPFSEGPCSLGWGVSIIGLLARVLHDARHGSRVTSDTPAAARHCPAVEGSVVSPDLRRFRRDGLLDEVSASRITPAAACLHTRRTLIAPTWAARFRSSAATGMALDADRMQMLRGMKFTAPRQHL